MGDFVLSISYEYGPLDVFMETLLAILDFFQHLPDHIAHWSDVMGPWVYVLLFCIIFAETGFVFTPILPGDSLLFAAGALTVGGVLSLPLLLVLLFVAAVTGDFLNYTVGRKIGLALFKNPKSRFFSRRNLDRATEFYQKHGGKTVILARFLPIIRTYAPFVAGVSQMPRRRYLPFNVVGAFLWTWSFLWIGFWFGDLPFVKQRFHYIILGIIVVTILPALIKFLKPGGSHQWRKIEN